MAEVGQYGGPQCATCGDRGITTNPLDGRPTQCPPCSQERREEQAKRWPYVLECTACTAVLRAADVERGLAKPRPTSWRVFGPLCGACMSEMERKSA